MTLEELFFQVDKILLQVTSVLEKEEKILGKKHENLQLSSDIKSGWVRRGGILIPLKLISHKILFDSYEYHLLETFLLFFKALYKERETLFTEFSLRTLLELGFYRAQILYSKKISDREKNKYKLLIWLADYSSMGIDNPEHAESYRKLLSEFGGLLDLAKKMYKPLLDMEKVLESGDREKHSDLVENIRKMIFPIQQDIYARTEPIPLFSKKKIKPIYSSWSHILHGNTLLLRNLFSHNTRPNQHKLRVHWFMLMSGVNVATHVANYLNLGELDNTMNSINKETGEIMAIVSQYWKTIEKEVV